VERVPSSSASSPPPSSLARWPALEPDAAEPAFGEVLVLRFEFAAASTHAAECEAFLAARELERAARYRRAQDRAQFVLGRGLLRAQLARALHCTPAQIELLEGVHGKPELAPAQRARAPHFNLAHAGGLGLIALTQVGPLGVDLEPHTSARGSGKAGERDLERLAERILGPEERREYEPLTPAARIAAFFDAWCAKEALLKALGEGLTRPPESIRLERVGTRQLAHVSEAAAAPWTAAIESLPLGPDWSAAVCVHPASGAWRVRARELPLGAPS
jgi:4'-phosphopantetheinyl transferase